MHFFNIIFHIISATTYFLTTSIIPKKNNLWVFGSWKGNNFSDNSKELFIYVSENCKDIDAIWIAKNPIVYKQVSDLGYKVVLYSSIRGKWTVARAEVNIQTESNQDTGFYRVGGAKIIQLFHGYGAVKEAHLYPNMGPLKKRIVKIYSENHTKSYWMVPSTYFVKRLPELFDTDENRTFITGQPRIDILFKNLRIKFFEDFKALYPQSTFLFYAPTHRNYASSDNLEFSNEEWLIFNEFCKTNNYICFFKPHPLELPKYLDVFKSFSNIILLSNDINGSSGDPYEYMHYFDLIISDYSSISTDFLIFDRPVVHFMYDIDRFESKHFTIQALDIFKAGPICKSWDELFHEINMSLEHDNHKYLREKVRAIAFNYIDNKNCYRVYNQILRIVNGR